MSSALLTSFQNLTTSGTEQDPAGYRGLDHYPFKEGMNFQAVDFPALAKQGEAKMMGNNQAFFFINNPKNNTDPDKMTLDTKNLKTLMENIRDNGTDFKLMIDADVLQNPKRFVEKYQSLRGEPDKAVREALLLKEAQLIADFVNSGGLSTLAQEVMAEPKKDAQSPEMTATSFLQHHFRLEGVVTQKPLENAVWQVDAGVGALIAKQNYTQSTHNVERPWQLGAEPALTALQEQGHTGAVSVKEAAAAMNRLPKVNLTLGNREISSEKNGPSF